MISVRSAVFAFVAATCASPVLADEVMGSYAAYIGIDDLYNSNGIRLSEPWQVLRQDRANFHRFGISQPGDEWDPLFADVDNRAALERLVRRGYISDRAARDILRGDAVVYVTIWSEGGRATFINVEVSR